MNTSSLLDDSIDPFNESPNKHAHYTPIFQPTQLSHDPSESIGISQSTLGNDEYIQNSRQSSDYPKDSLPESTIQPQAISKNTSSPKDAAETKQNTPARQSYLAITVKDSSLNQAKKSTATYRFDVSTNISSFKRQRYLGVERSHQEFEKLAKHLSLTYTQCLVLSFPSLPMPSPLTNIKDSPELDLFTRYFVQLWVNWIASHPILKLDYELRNFVETPFAFNPTRVSFSGEKSRAEIEYDNFHEPKKSLFFSGWPKTSIPKLSLSSQLLGSQTPHDLQSTATNSAVTTENAQMGSLSGASNLTALETEFLRFGQEFSETSAPLLASKKSVLNLAMQKSILAKNVQEMAQKLVGLGNLDQKSSKKIYLKKEKSASLPPMAHPNAPPASDINSASESSFLAFGHLCNASGRVQHDISVLEGTLPPLFMTNIERFNRDVVRSLSNRAQLFDDLKLTRLNLERKKQAITVLRSSTTIVPKHVDETLTKMDAAKADEAAARKKADQKKSARAQLAEELEQQEPRDGDAAARGLQDHSQGRAAEIAAGPVAAVRLLQTQQC
ncbi:Vacuolar protein sorting-associated protein 17 [Smittium culicis]|uniref:Vacuolar protein sorting-associated protein 17 n=1 Tax=Smittium culicis TaxID=133412 RepID=A0A1R1XWM2_9FUNG|nr:Vacuolar protein sorting-associated protein 17 [Smittium culicis]